MGWVCCVLIHAKLQIVCTKMFCDYYLLNLCAIMLEEKRNLGKGQKYLGITRSLEIPKRNVKMELDLKCAIIPLYFDLLWRFTKSPTHLIAWELCGIVNVALSGQEFVYFHVLAQSL